MSVFNYKRYKVSLRHDTKKTQGLQTGDVVRRQYFDGKNLIYSLMCVLDHGVDQLIGDDNEVKQQPYFIGALLEGDPPAQDEILDFARITNLFDLDRSGAMYLTASDDKAPFMDVIDGIGFNASICWPTGISNTDQIDPKRQYVAIGGDSISCVYHKRKDGTSRVCDIKLNSPHSGYVGLKQDFYKYVENPNMVLISYKIKASKNIALTASLAYSEGDRVDGQVEVNADTEWQYKFHSIVIDWSGRHLRTFKLDMSTMDVDDTISISDFNIILLSSISNFKDASQIRIGKLDGIMDPVFGKLDGYGGYLQKLYASRSAHVSGTLTAGDEHGFGSTFYAGKIHRNVFINSQDIGFTSQVTVDSAIISPTGVGKVYTTDSSIEMVAQTSDWALEKIGSQYCLSFWAYFKSKCTISVLQNGSVIGMLTIDGDYIHSWHRLHTVFEITDTLGNDVLIELSPIFDVDDAQYGDEAVFCISSPQLEAGESVTQYQPTDDVLNFTEDYGAWFNRGGVGGTIQNPLLQLNYDGDGSIGTRTKSLLLRMNGSGYLANKNIQWDENGKVTFGEDVTLNWDNLGDSVKDELVSKSIKITGADTFTILGDMSTDITSYSPNAIELTLTEENIESSSSQRQWYYLYNNEYIRLPNANSKSLTVLPDGSYWGSDNTLTIKCVVTINQSIYSDTITIRKQFIVGYTVEITSHQGMSFKNGSCQTVLTADVYYQGKLVSPAYIADNFTFMWKKYHLPNIESEDLEWYKEQSDDLGNIVQEEIDRTSSEIVLNYPITGRDLFVCELQNGAMFPYTFPVIF